eukprot:CAMPEP_0173260068 /NCGR_PEP_ID=MMETSP1142-20121109/25361_1 /TAXON_ID=483371 /ORGANISM="non described non described, Strain CCMP2298" /LENGTH=46 /DNA_ID= /DNA_START= /DNA_END= /DNA_ORIENTATION=
MSSSSSVSSASVSRAFSMRVIMIERSFLHLRMFSCTDMGSSAPVLK